MVDSPKSQRKVFGRNKTLKEYRSQCPQTLCDYLKDKNQHGIDLSQCFSEPVFASVLLADISGFTNLSSRLEVEDLKRHINNFFTLLLDNIIKRHKGDVVKFCGDACLIMWSCSVKSFHNERKSVALKAVRCALDLLQEISQYNSGTGDKAVSLRLHCGMSVGTLFCMSLGSPTRMEFLISGPVLAEVGLAESEAETGEICLSGSAFTLVATEFNAEVKPKGSIRITSVRKKESNDSGGRFLSCFPFHRRVLPRGMRGRRNPKIYIDTGAVEELGGDNSASVGFMDHSDPPASGKFSNALLQQLTSAQSEDREYKRALSRYVHESVRNVIDGSNSGHEAQLRDVTTMFIQLLNLDEDFNTGKHQRPQQAILEVLDVLTRVGGGALRQYVVDDKGCVIICCFGVPGFSSSNSNVRAISAAMRIRDGLKQYDILCQIGIASGMVYCGYVGSKYRKEYSMMGSSVNLAARLMGKSEASQILVDRHVYIDAQDEFAFDTLQPIQAKGYADPVSVYSPTTPLVNMESSTLDDLTKRSSTIKTLGLVGRSFELSMLNNAFKKYVMAEESSKYAVEGVARLDTTLSSNKFVIIGGPRYGKTALIDEFLKGNKMLNSTARVNCHYANVYEPYEVIRQLLKTTISHATSSAQSNSADDSEMKFGGSISFDEFDDGNPGSLEEDVEFRVLEDIYAEIVLWVQTNLSTLKFTVAMDKTKESVFHSDSFSRAGSFASSEKREEWERYEFIMSSRSASFHASLRKTNSIVRASFSTHEDEHGPNPSIGEDPSVSLSPHQPAGVVRGSLSFGISEVLPLLRIVLDTAETPENLLPQVTEEGINDILTALCGEIVKALVNTSKSKTLVVEDLQWCDKESFAILMVMVESMETGLFISSMRTTEDSKTTAGHRYARCASFEGSANVNSMHEVTAVCKGVHLNPLSRHQIEVLIRAAIKPSIISSNPNVVSGKNISNIMVRSGGGIPGEVVDNIRHMQSVLARARFGVVRPSTSNRNGELPRFDKLSVEQQIVLKMASVCGTTFSLYTVNLTLEKMGYSTIKNKTEKIFVDIEEKGLIKRVFATQDRKESKGNIVSGPSPKATTDFGENLRQSPASFRGLGNSFRGSFRSPGLANPKLKMYTFLEKGFRENIYSVMLESQREMVHRIIAEDLENAYQEETRPAYQEAETLAFHFTKARELHKQIYYTEAAARRAHEVFMPLTAFHQLNQLFLVAFQQKTIEQVLQASFRQMKTSYYSIFSVAIRNRRDFGNVFVTKMYISASDLTTKVQSSNAAIPSPKLIEYVLEMSILKYKICDLTDCHNLAVLGTHMLRVNTHPFHRVTMPIASKRLLALSYFYRGDILLMRGLVHEARIHVDRALKLLPTHEDVGERLHMLSVLDTIKCFEYGKLHMKPGQKKVMLIDRGSSSFSCIQLHSCLAELARGDILAAQDVVMGAATKMLRKDSSPLPLQIENVTSWLHFLRGNPQILRDCLRNLSPEDQTLRKIWSLELIAVIYILKGDFGESKSVLEKLCNLQQGHYGCCFHDALKGFVATFEGKFCSPDAVERDRCVNSIVFAVDKMSQRVQTSPIGMVSLFFAAYAGQHILSKYAEKRSTGDDLSGLLRRGGGLEFRLDDAVRNATECLTILSRTIPVLRVLTDALVMQRICYLQQPPNLAFNVEYFCQFYRRDDTKQFVFGLAFWHVERLRYCQYCDLTNQIAQLESSLGDTGGSASLSSCHERLGIGNDHPFLRNILPPRSRERKPFSNTSHSSETCVIGSSNT